MNDFLLLNPYILALLAFTTGAAFGWLINGLLERRARHQRENHQSSPQMDLEHKQAILERLTQELKTLEERRNTLDTLIQSTQNVIQQKDDDYASLLIELDEQQRLLDDAVHDLETIQQNLKAHKETAQKTLTAIDSHTEEIEVLTQIRDANLVKINRLTQQVQWQDNELQMLRQTIDDKERERTQLQSLLEHHEHDLKRLMRERQQRENDIKRAKDELSQLNSTFYRVMQKQSSVQSRSEHSNTEANKGAIDDSSLLLADSVRTATAFSRENCNEASLTNSDFTQIPGMAEAYIARLQDNGIATYCDLAVLTPKELANILRLPGHFSPDYDGWIQAARKLATQAPQESA